MLFFAGVLDLGRIAATQIALSNAAREGAVQAGRTPADFDPSVGCPDGKTNLIYCRVKYEAAGASIKPTDVTVSCKPDPTCKAGIGQFVTVRVQGSFQLLTPLLAAFFNGNQSVSLASSSTQNVETLPTSGVATPTATPTPTPNPSPSPTASPSPTPPPQPCATPSAGFTYTTTPKSGQSPVTVTVTDTSTSPGCVITSWTWSWGDGTTSSGRVPGSHTYNVRNPNNSGFYEVSLRVTNATASSTTGAVQVTVK